MKVLIGVGVILAASVPVAVAVADERPRPVGGVVEAGYDLGAAAFRYKGLKGPVELTGSVAYPRDPGRRARPLVMMLHGLADTCDDRRAWDAYQSRIKASEKAREAGREAEADRLYEQAWKARAPLAQWPCRKGVRAVPSHRGYRYLARSLAARGYVVVSIGANGINAAEQGDGYLARRALLDHHLTMWKRLADTGGGPLAGRFRDPRTGRPVKVAFRGRVDLANVGTFGHSRGGGGVLSQVLDGYRTPRGVRIRAVFAMAPAMNGIDDQNGRISGVPYAVMAGTCDAMWDESTLPLDMSPERRRYPAFHFSVRGANHNFFNTQWTPGTGPVSAEDDVRAGGRALPGGRCRTAGGPEATARQLTPDGQHRVADAYVTAFFDRYLRGVRSADAVLTGRARPVRKVTTVDVRVRSPRG